MLNKKFAAMLDIVGLLSVASIPIFALPLLKISLSQAQSTSSPSAFTVPSTLPADAKINIDGSSSMAMLNQALSQDFKKKFAGSTVTVSSEGTAVAIEKLEKGEVDLASIGRTLTSEEKAQGLSATSIGREKIAIVVGSENPFKGNITFAQFAKLFRGEITDWAELGREPGPIRFIDRPETSDTRQAFRAYPVFSETEFVNGQNTESLSEDSTDAMVKKLGKDGIGYAIAHQVINRPDVQIISMHKTLPDDARYPFSQPRGFAYKGNPNPAVQAFLGFATAPDGQESLRIAQTNGLNAEGVAGSSGSGSVSNSAAVGGATSPSESPNVALATDSATETNPQGGLPWWPLLLGIPLAGGLLWGFTRRKEGSATETSPERSDPPPYVPSEPAILPEIQEPTALMPPVDAIVPPVEPTGLEAGLSTGLGVAGLAGLAGLGAAGLAAGMGVGADRKSRIVLTPRNHEEAYAYWEVSEAEKDALRQQGGQAPLLKIHDVTDGDESNDQTPHGTQHYNWDEQSQDRHVTLPVGDRDYVAELGYDTADGRWLQLARSSPVRVPAAPNISPINPVIGGAVVGGAAIAGGVLIPGADAWGRFKPTDNTFVLDSDEDETLFEDEALVGDEALFEDEALVGDAELSEDGSLVGDETLFENLTPPTENTFILDTKEEDEALFGDDALFGSDLLSDTTPDLATMAGGMAMAGAAAGATFSVGTPLTSATAESVDPHETASIDRCAMTNLRIDRQQNAYLLAFAATDQIRQSAASKVLIPGQYLLKIRSGGFGYQSDASKNEPWVILWIHGGRFVNKKTGTEAISTWSSLNGYDEVLSLDVLEETTLSAFFIDTAMNDNQGEVNIAVVKL
jgi:phosphate transport system substrate-binding protein